MYSPRQIKALLITPMVGGTVSIISSVTLISMILRSEIKLSIPSRRIFFGLCLYDCIFSLVPALSTIPVPKEEDIWGASGNRATCDFQGFIMQVGLIGSNYYTCSLSIYYFCIIRLSMTEATFAKKVEPFCHLIPIVYGIGGALYLLNNGYFNNIGNACWIGPSPINCITDSDVECLRGSNDAYDKRWIFYGYSVYFVWFVIIFTMTSIVYKVARQRQSADRWATGNTFDNRNLCQSLFHKFQDLFTRRAHDSSSHKVSETELETSTNDDNVSNLRRPSPSRPCRSSFRAAQGQQDPLAFNLRAMRAQTKRRSLIMTEDQASNGGTMHSLQQSDPHPFDVETAIYCVSKGGSSKSFSPSQPSIRPPPLLDLEEESSQLRKKKRRLSVTIEGSFTEENRKSISFSCKDAPAQIPTMRGHSLENAQRAVAFQALLYIFGFFLCFAWSMAVRILEQNGKEIPFGIYYMARVMLPLQGLFNVLLYSRPFVLSLRRSHPELSLWKAFRITVMSGGDNLTRSSFANSSNVSQKIRDRIEQNNRERIQSIRQTRRGSMFGSTTSSTPRYSQRLSLGSSLPNETGETGNEKESLPIEACSLISTIENVRLKRTAEPQSPESLTRVKDPPAEENTISKNGNINPTVAGAADPETSEYCNLGVDCVRLDSSVTFQDSVSKPTTDKCAPELPASAKDEITEDNNDAGRTTEVKSYGVIEISEADDNSDVDLELQ